MSIFHRPPKPHSHRAPGRFTRFPLPPGMPGIDTHLYVEMDEPGEPETAAPDATMHLPVVEDEREATLAAIEETPAVRPLPARIPFEFAVPTEFPPKALTHDEMFTLQRVADRLRALPSEPAAYLFSTTPAGEGGPHEALTGVPSFAGLRRLADGTLIAGLFLGDEDGDGRFGVDALDRTWLLQLRDAIEDALWAIEQAGHEAAEGSAA